MRNQDLTNNPVELKSLLQTAWGKIRWNNQVINKLTKENEELKCANKDLTFDINILSAKVDELNKFILDNTE